MEYYHISPLEYYHHITVKSVLGCSPISNVSVGIRHWPLSSSKWSLALPVFMSLGQSQISFWNPIESPDRGCQASCCGGCFSSFQPSWDIDKESWCKSQPAGICTLGFGIHHFGKTWIFEASYRHFVSRMFILTFQLPGVTEPSTTKNSRIRKAMDLEMFAENSKVSS